MGGAGYRPRAPTKVTLSTQSCRDDVNTRWPRVGERVRGGGVLVSTLLQVLVHPINN